MLRKFNILPLFLACFLILGHSVFPHTHQKISGDEFILGVEALNCDSGILNLLHSVFSQDLGDNHLENFNKAQQDLPAFLFVAQAFLHTLLHFNTETKEEKAYTALEASPKLFAEFILKDAPLRAPPHT
ncbi:hypothetical protein [Catalinimonas alkaloidigena]|uniref:hypothetical protein n=1 Tax=Catalinimonas alkaloidigena TaxID=1075417 RepID=UPI002406CEF0|nr:hypothetical protein [Catalinimonas alkaloidigena]